MLYKRIDDISRAVKDFKRVAELNPRTLDAAREVRLYNMRGGSKAPPPPGGTGATATASPGGAARNSKPPPPPEARGGLFGKLFKK
jgi:hypothetical protein